MQTRLIRLLSLATARIVCAAAAILVLSAVRAAPADLLAQVQWLAAAHCGRHRWTFDSGGTSYTLGLFFALMPATLRAIAVQYITPHRQRATMAAAFVLTLNLLGFGLGPMLVALITDFVLPLSIVSYLICMPSLRRAVDDLMLLPGRHLFQVSSKPQSFPSS